MIYPFVLCFCFFVVLSFFKQASKALKRVSHHPHPYFVSCKELFFYHGTLAGFEKKTIRNLFCAQLLLPMSSTLCFAFQFWRGTFHELFSFLCLALPCLPWGILHFNIGKIRKRIYYESLYVVDLIKLSLEAGLNLTSSIDEVTALFFEGPLKNEFQRMQLSLQLGLPLDKAFAELFARTQVPVFESLGNLCAQSVAMGTNISDLFLKAAQTQREKNINAAQAKAQKTSVYLLIPMMLFIFPVLFILTLGPVVIPFFTR